MDDWRARRDADPEKYKRLQREADQRRDPEKIKARNAAYYAANREKEIARSLMWAKLNPAKDSARTSRRHAARMRRTMSWADHDLIADIYALAAIYRDAGIACEVDHQVPLRGKKVSGLHTHHNLTVLPKFLNRAKGNRFNLELGR